MKNLHSEVTETGYLEQIGSPADVKKLTQPQLKILCEEIRSFLIENVSKTGGHLSSNLGTVELTVALHKIFSTPTDQIVWDVGHQCYTHKLLTGRKDGFAHLRQENGLSGFPNPSESEHDAFIAGHGSTALSAAIGLAQGKRLRSEKGKVIAIIGDGAFTGGMVYEGMNNIRTLSNLIVILNDNKMSISKNVGSVAQYLTQLRTSPGYFKAKRDVQSVWMPSRLSDHRYAWEFRQLNLLFGVLCTILPCSKRWAFNMPAQSTDMILANCAIFFQLISMNRAHRFFCIS